MERERGYVALCMSGSVHAWPAQNIQQRWCHLRAVNTASSKHCIKSHLRVCMSVCCARAAASTKLAATEKKRATTTSTKSKLGPAIPWRMEQGVRWRSRTRKQLYHITISLARVHVFQSADTPCCGSKSPNKYALHYLKVLYYRLRATML